MLVGVYADAVSADGISECELLKKAGCERTFGPATPLSDAIEFLRSGDTLMVVNLLRLSSTLIGLILLLEQLQAKGVAVHAIENRVLPGTALGDTIGQACSILAAFHRSVFSSALKQKRNRRGRPMVLVPDDQMRAERLLKRSSVAEVAHMLKVSPATIYRHFPRRESGAIAYGSGGSHQRPQASPNVGRAQTEPVLAKSNL